MDKGNSNLLTSLAEEIGRRISLAHHVPGRLRVRVDPTLAQHPKREAFEEWVPKLGAFELLDVNIWAKSAVIGYDASNIPPQWVDELFATQDPERKKAILEQIKDQVS
jgi:hypothetical protein